MSIMSIDILTAHTATPVETLASGAPIETLLSALSSEPSSPQTRSSTLQTTILVTVFGAWILFVFVLSVYIIQRRIRAARMEISDEENPRVRFTVEYRPRRSVAKQNVFTPAELDLMPALTFAEYKSSGAKHAWPKHKHSVLMLDGLADKQKAADIDAISIHSESLEEQHVAMQNAIAQQQECAGTTDGKNDTDDMCAVCIDGFDAESAVRALVCGHVFHCECIDRWLLSKSSRCPLCNSDTRTSLGLPQRPPKAKTADTLRQA